NLPVSSALPASTITSIVTIGNTSRTLPLRVIMDLVLATPAQIHGSSPRAELRLTATPREITSARVAGLVPVVATAPSKLGRTARAASITGWVRGPITNTNCLEAIRTRQRRAQLRTFLLTRTLLAVPGFTTATDTMKLDQDRGTRSVQIPRLSF